jgi:hypothetical protein
MSARPSDFTDPGRTTPAPRAIVRALAFAAIGLAVLAFVLPPLAQPQDYHAFADTRTLLGIPNAADVLSNVAFLAAGLLGIAASARGRLHFASTGQRDALHVAYAGLVLTALGSAYYHLAPTDATLVLDRCGMVVAFAGVGASVAARLGDRTAHTWLVVALAGGLASVATWAVTGNLAPYAVVQFGGLALALTCLVAVRTPLAPEPRFLVVLGGYVVAKVLEHHDASLFALTGGTVAGHPLKHLVSGIGTFWLVLPLLRR